MKKTQRHWHCAFWVWLQVFNFFLNQSFCRFALASEISHSENFLFSSVGLVFLVLWFWPEAQSLTTAPVYTCFEHCSFKHGISFWDLIFCLDFRQFKCRTSPFLQQDILMWFGSLDSVAPDPRNGNPRPRETCLLFSGLLFRSFWISDLAHPLKSRCPIQKPPPVWIVVHSKNSFFSGLVDLCYLCVLFVRSFWLAVPKSQVFLWTSSCIADFPTLPFSSPFPSDYQIAFWLGGVVEFHNCSGCRCMKLYTCICCLSRQWLSQALESLTFILVFPNVEWT